MYTVSPMPCFILRKKVAFLANSKSDFLTKIGANRHKIEKNQQNIYDVCKKYRIFAAKKCICKCTTTI